MFVKHIKDDWEIKDNVTHDDLMSTYVNKYNNMVKQGHWKEQESKEATIISLTTKISNFENQMKSGGNSTVTGAGTSVTHKQTEP